MQVTKTAPRIRGDGPWVTTDEICDNVCSPHPRGWSPPGRFDPAGRALLPGERVTLSDLSGECGGIFEPPHKGFDDGRLLLGQFHSGTAGWNLAVHRAASLGFAPCPDGRGQITAGGGGETARETSATGAADGPCPK
ncbi:hypothetical protein Stube_13280 [Streptomyces tubercidicus]|uniref:Uncharacterized protein n=1 Tax=Streptomyces tubercidicus TaxID=47759 RepID=A0A640UQU6_9ACTN|nr:hypothetical protein Stube_13280 [Streptomyces tubercidicus]